MPGGGEDTFWGWAGCCPGRVDRPVHILHLGCGVDNLSRAVMYGQLFEFPISETALLQHRLWAAVGEHGLSLTLPLITECSFPSVGDSLEHSSQPRRSAVGRQGEGSSSSCSCTAAWLCQGESFKCRQ